MPTNDDVELQFTKADSDRLLRIEMRLETALLGMASLEAMRTRIETLEREKIALAAVEMIRERIQTLERDKAMIKGMLLVWAPICTTIGVLIEKYLLK